MTAPSLTVAILAGGASTRLGGRDKGLEPLLGRPLIDWATDRWKTREDIALVVVANRHHDEYARYAPVIRDVAQGFKGPLAGIAAALAFSTTPHLLTVPVDCPDPPADVDERLAASLRDANATVAFDGERRQPLFALYRRETAESAAAAVLAGQGVWQWQDAIGAREVDFSGERRKFHNLNTPEEFAAYADDVRSRD
jgi:molybdopterin-guanine dinucleotide biosynthesis protein A